MEGSTGQGLYTAKNKRCESDKDIKELERLLEKSYEKEDEYLEIRKKRRREERRISKLLYLYTEEKMEDGESFEYAKFLAASKFCNELDKLKELQIELDEKSRNYHRARDNVSLQSTNISRKTATLEAEKLVEKVKKDD